MPAPEKTEKKKFSLKGFGGKKKKRWLKILIILVVVIAIGVRDHPGPDRERTAEPPVRPALCQHCLRRSG
ncbi:Uncharacterised protein [uncultured Blautia sp.]|nr:Uncharacterised protein [uncultured Blautia sp.]